uniref:Large ribosomal subunit protein bL12c n=1 Tax=Pseudobryopsis hainanensis TaxID=2320808 RepID=A0A3S7SXW8_9CHLO|nr:ribosomal protein L12 [Pseudobryopsis hainanensis]
MLEKLKTLTLLEASELVTQIEETFGVDASASVGAAVIAPESGANASSEQQTEFDVILEEVPGDDNKSARLAIFRVLREITSLGLKEAKELTTALPKTIQEAVSRESADEAKKLLEDAGARVKIK